MLDFHLNEVCQNAAHPDIFGMEHHVLSCYATLKAGLVRTNISAEGGTGAAEVAAQMQEVTLKASVLSAKNAVQQELDDLYAVGYDGCDTALTEAETSSGAVNHKDCRTVEAESKTTFDSCAEEEAELKKAKEAACKAVLQSLLLGV